MSRPDYDAMSLDELEAAFPYFAVPEWGGPLEHESIDEAVEAYIEQYYNPKDDYRQIDVGCYLPCGDEPGCFERVYDRTVKLADVCPDLAREMGYE